MRTAAHRARKARLGRIAPMFLTPTLKVERVAQLDPGELFLFELDGVKSVGFVCDYRDPGSTKLVLPLGPKFAPYAGGPRLIELRTTAISFGTEFVIRLPADPQDWSASEPADDQQCLLVTGTTVYFRGNGSGEAHRFRTCFVNVATGVVEVQPGSGNYARPTGTGAYATSWEIVTTEDKPRTILKYPFANA
jgi:hypothetical protein